MLSNTWIIGDTHFGHQKLCEYCGRPSDFEYTIISKWRDMIKDDDIVYHLGDVFFKDCPCINTLPGTKILIKGNHDKKSMEFYLELGFSAVVGFIVVPMTIDQIYGERCYQCYQRILLSHVPMSGFVENDLADINLHGHFHNNPISKCEPELVNKLTDNHYLFSLERSEYSPIMASSILWDSAVNRTLDLLRSEQENEKSIHE